MAKNVTKDLINLAGMLRRIDVSDNNAVGGEAHDLIGLWREVSPVSNVSSNESGMVLQDISGVQPTAEAVEISNLAPHHELKTGPEWQPLCKDAKLIMEGILGTFVVNVYKNIEQFWPDEDYVPSCSLDVKRKYFHSKKWRYLFDAVPFETLKGR